MAVCATASFLARLFKSVGVGVHNGQLERRVLPGEGGDQAPIVKIRCSRADPSNKADMHFANLPHRSYRVERCSMRLEWWPDSFRMVGNTEGIIALSQCTKSGAVSTGRCNTI